MGGADELGGDRQALGDGMPVHRRVAEIEAHNGEVAHETIIADVRGERREIRRDFPGPPRRTGRADTGEPGKLSTANWAMRHRRTGQDFPPARIPARGPTRGTMEVRTN
ncbi:hypothetical protein GCM10009700_11880 [Brevibacterium sanguinis]